MSQAKVDRNKEQKAHRKQIVAHEKRKLALARFGGAVILAALLGWAGYSAYAIYENNQPALYADLTAVSDYTASLSDTE